MRKRIVTPPAPETPSAVPGWLDLEALSEVEVTSEDERYPVESALVPAHGAGWRAAAPGRQVIRLLFDQPQSLRRIWLSFTETESERTQEYLLRWSPDGGKSFRDIVRQQWTFSPGGSTSETEKHEVELSGVTVLELAIVPDIRGGEAVASLAQLRLA